MDVRANIFEGSQLNPTPELPDDTPIDFIQFSTRIHKALVAAGLKTIGEIRETRMRYCSTFRISDPVRSPISAKRWACHRAMELGY
jgi:hypothetical protein